MRLHELRRPRHADMGVDVDGEALGPDLAARAAHARAPPSARTCSRLFAMRSFPVRWWRSRSTPRCCAIDGLVRLAARRAALEDHRARVDDDDVVGEVEGELDVLLDEHDRQALRLEPGDRAADIGDDLRGEPLGRLVHQQHARVAHQRPADGQHLLLAAGEQAASCWRRSPRRGNIVEHRVGGPGPRRRLRACAPRRSRFSRTVRLLNTRRPCGTSATPLRGDGLGRARW